MDKIQRAKELTKGVKAPSWDRYQKYGDKLPILEQLAWATNFFEQMTQKGIGKKLEMSQAELNEVESIFDTLLAAAEEQQRLGAEIVKKVNPLIEEKRHADAILGRRAEVELNATLDELLEGVRLPTDDEFRSKLETLSICERLAWMRAKRKTMKLASARMPKQMADKLEADFKGFVQVALDLKAKGLDPKTFLVPKEAVRLAKEQTEREGQPLIGFRPGNNTSKN